MDDSILATLAGVLVIETILRVSYRIHPISLIRLLAVRVANKVRPATSANHKLQLIYGTLSLVVPFLPILITLQLFVYIAAYPVFFDALLLWTAISFSNEHFAFRKVKQALTSKKNTLAKTYLETLVKRNCRELSNIGIAKAAIESLALRWVYQVLTVSCIYLCLGGVAALAYRITLECKWQWHLPNRGTNDFYSKPVVLICRLLQAIPLLIATLATVLCIGKRKTQRQQREPVTTLRAQQSTNKFAGIYMSMLANKLGFAISGPKKYANVRIDAPRLGAPLQVRLSDMTSVQWAIGTLHCLLICTIVVLAFIHPISDLMV